MKFESSKWPLVDAPFAPGRALSTPIISADEPRITIRTTQECKSAAWGSSPVTANSQRASERKTEEELTDFGKKIPAQFCSQKKY